MQPTVEITEDSIRLEIPLTIPPPRVWELFSEAYHRSAWWGDHVELDVAPGGMLKEVWSDGTREVITTGRILRCDYPRTLEMSWADDDWSGRTTVRFSFFPEESGTRVILDHTGWRVHPDGQRERLVGMHASGWSRIIQQLQNYVEDLPEVLES